MTTRARARAAWEILRALGAMVVIEASLRADDLPGTCRRLRVRCDLDSAAPPGTRRAILPRNTRATVTASRAVVTHWPCGDTCLRRCLLIGHRLHRLRPVLRIGVTREADGAFSAHSWLEIDGATLDPQASRYAALGSGCR